MRFYWIYAKLWVFVLSAFLFLPLIVFVGQFKYVQGIFNGLQRFIDELYYYGCITKDEKNQLEDEFMGG